MGLSYRAVPREAVDGWPMWGKRRLRREVPCAVCLKSFLQYPHGRPRFCSKPCSLKAMSDLFSKQVVRQCQHCGKDFKTNTSASRAAGKRDQFCSRECGTTFRRKHWFEPCVRCGGPVLVKPCDRKFHAKKYCSLECYWMTVRESEDMRRAPRKDDNHDEITELFEKSGFIVLDLSGSGRGVPDILVALGNVVKFVEIKNPKTSYGRRGLSDLQRKFKARFPVSVVLGLDQATEFIAQFKALKTDKERNHFIYPPEQLDALRAELMR
jgi:Holliday junction resolvase